MDTMNTGVSADVQPTQVQNTNVQSQNVGNEPDALDLTDESRLVRIPGVDKPVKWSEHVKGLQAQGTRAAQKAAQFERLLQARDKELQSLKQAQQQSQYNQNQAKSSEDVFQSLRTLPYLSGEQAAGVVEQIVDQFKQRDMVLLAALKQMQAMKQQLTTVYGEHTNSAFMNKVRGWLKEGNYPDEAFDLAQEIYTAYEGDDLDEQFPTIFRNRWEQLQRIFNKQQMQQREKSRQGPFIPGKGGNAGPNKPLELKANASAKEIADSLFGQWEGSGT